MQPLELDTSSIQVPGLDVSLPPLANNLSDALQHFGTETPPPPLPPRLPPLSTTPSFSPPSQHSTPSVTSVPKIAKTLTKRRRVTYWTRHEIATLLHGLAMAGARLDKLASVVPTRSAENCRKQLRAIAERIRPILPTPTAPHSDSTPVLSKEQCASIILRHHGLSLPKASPPGTLSQWRSLGAKHKLAVQVVPHTDQDAACIEALKHNPCVEVLLRASRSVWDVLCHLYSKWGYPIRLLAPDGTVLDIAENVLQVVRKHGVQRDRSVVRLQFSILKLQVDWSVMSQSARISSANATSKPARKRSSHVKNRTYAPLVPTTAKVCYPFGSPLKSQAIDSADADHSNSSSHQRTTLSASNKDDVSLITLPASSPTAPNLPAREASYVQPHHDVAMLSEAEPNTPKKESVGKPTGHDAVMQRLKGHLASLSEETCTQKQEKANTECEKGVEPLGDSLNAEFLTCVQDADIGVLPRLSDSLFETPLLERSSRSRSGGEVEGVKPAQPNLFLLQDNALDGCGFGFPSDKSPEIRARGTPMRSGMFSGLLSPPLGITSHSFD